MQCLPQVVATPGRHYYISTPRGESHIFPHGTPSPKENVIVSLSICTTTQSGVSMGNCSCFFEEMMSSLQGNDGPTLRKCVHLLGEMFVSP